LAAHKKAALLVLLVPLGAWQCKPPAAATLKDASLKPPSITRDCYTLLDVAHPREEGRSGEPIDVRFASGDCLDQGGLDYQTLDRSAIGREAYYDAQGKEFPAGRAPKYKFCRAGNKVVLRKDCGDDKDVIEVGTVEALGAIKWSPAVVHADIALHGSRVIKAAYEHFEPKDMEIWLFGKLPAGIQAQAACRPLRKTRTAEQQRAIALAASKPLKLVANVASLEVRPVIHDEPITFYGHIGPMLRSTVAGANYGCTTCHSEMRDPKRVEEYVRNGTMAGWVKRDPAKGYAPMPTFGNDMTEDDVKLFDRWAAGGFQLGEPLSPDDDARAFYANQKPSPPSSQVLETKGDGRSCQ
jgi:hypothetical protein